MALPDAVHCSRQIHLPPQWHPKFASQDLCTGSPQQSLCKHEVTVRVHQTPRVYQAFANWRAQIVVARPSAWRARHCGYPPCTYHLVWSIVTSVINQDEHFLNCHHLSLDRD